MMRDVEKNAQQQFNFPTDLNSRHDIGYRDFVIVSMHFCIFVSS